MLMKNILNYFALTLILLNILQNVVIHLFRYFVCNIMVHFYTTWQIKFPCVA